MAGVRAYGNFRPAPAKSGGAYVSSYMCSPETAAEEFETAKLLYEMSAGRSQPEGRDIIAYRILQFFAPGEITPEEANRLGYELAMKFTKGRHQFVVSTHIDKAAAKRGRSHKERLRQTIDRAARQLEGRMAESAQMKTHILNYSKTREIYREYRKSRYKEQFRAAHADAIAKHEAAKAAFDNLGGKQIPKVAELNKEYAALLAEKKACYEEYKAARKEMLDYKAALQNVNKLLGLEPQKQEQKRRAQEKKNQAGEQQNEAGKKRRETDR